MKAIFSATILCFALLALTSSAAAGAYQHTIDGQTLVWNNYPDPDDSASWSGQRDRQRYATGSGTLTWYKRQVLVSRYSGTMHMGKWNGVVDNEDADGKKFRGTFVNGNKARDWVQVNGFSSVPNQPGQRGTYQKTHDGRASVWNNYPNPSDQAAWEGQVDVDGYATGEGKLSWFKNGQWVSNYLGIMVRGKWNGLVINQDANGNRFQGTFVDGVKTSDWAQVNEFDLRPKLTPEEKALNDHWANYLKDIQADNEYPNWSGPPYDLYASKQ
jgi:hypothetical protein